MWIRPGSLNSPFMIKLIISAAVVAVCIAIAGLWLLVGLAWLYHCWMHRARH